jgi:(p)ppGpp synthase/HD superfamily hydrolase
MTNTQDPDIHFCRTLEEFNARAFAVKKHGDQKYGERKYVFHLDQVAALCRYYGLSAAERVAAYLHDTMEDTDTSNEELTLRFGKEPAELVYAVSGEGKTRAECRASIIAKLTAYPEAVNLKLLDRLANVKACLKEGKLHLVAMYRDEMPYYAPLFSQGHPDAWAELCRLMEWDDNARHN